MYLKSEKLEVIYRDRFGHLIDKRGNLVSDPACDKCKEPEWKMPARREQLEPQK